MISRLFTSAALAAAVLLITAGGCSNNSTNPTTSGPPPPVTSTDTLTVLMAGNQFTPSNPIVALHKTILWYNNSTVTHTSTSYNGVWDTGDVPPGTGRTTTFNTAGSYQYHCIYHTMMVGTVTVR